MFKRGDTIILGCVVSKKSTLLYIINTKECKKKIVCKGLIGIFSQLEKLQIVQQKKPSIISSLFLAAKYAATK